MATSSVDGSIKDMFGPLTFEDAEDNVCPAVHLETSCLLCDDKFNLKIGLHIFVKHIFEAHRLVIEDIQNITDLSSYVLYWKERFLKAPYDSVVPGLSLGAGNERYHLLSTLMKEDREIRHKLRLENALKVQQFERTDTNYRKNCLFCRLDFSGTRQDFLNHLSEQHNLQLGNPQNLVHVDDLISHIEGKLQALECVYCEKVFPERNVLKEHMRKKLHKRINPKNRSYDRYYMVNYLEIGKNWQGLQKEDDRLPVVNGEENSDEEYSDWNEKCDEITCLFCQTKKQEMPHLFEHMLNNHGFDFPSAVRDLDFYQKIKLINYIRRQVHAFNCIYCERHCGDNSRLLNHMEQEGHFDVPPDAKVFDQPLYYFPTYENDAFLYLIDDTED